MWRAEWVVWGPACDVAGGVARLAGWPVMWRAEWVVWLAACDVAGGVGQA
jgi:hypothetical protein